MRHSLAIAAAFLALQAPAFASSIEAVSMHNGSGSIVVKSCGHCPASEAKAKRGAYVVPALKPGTQTVEIREINGEKKLVRTEAWLGGSPVVYVSKAPDTETAATPAITTPAAPVSASMTGTEVQAVTPRKADLAPAIADGVDPSATTSALGVQPEAGASAQIRTAKALDPLKFELRLQ